MRTPFEELLRDPSAETVATLNNAVLAAANLHHARGGLTENSARAVQAVVAGRTEEPGVAGSAMATARNKIRGNLTQAIGYVLDRVPAAGLDDVTQFMRQKAADMMARVTYPATDYTRATRFLANNVNPNRKDVSRAAREAQALLHHFSDDPLAPPAVLHSEDLASILTSFRRRYVEWADERGIPPATRTYQLMDSLLGITGSRELQSLRQILGSDPEQAEELRILFHGHLVDMFTGFLQMGDVRISDVQPAVSTAAREKSDKEQGRGVKAKKVAAAAGSSAAAAADVRTATEAKPPAKKAAPAKPAPAKKSAAETPKAPEKTAPTEPAAPGDETSGENVEDGPSAAQLGEDLSEVEGGLLSVEEAQEALVAAAAEVAADAFSTEDDIREAKIQVIANTSAGAWLEHDDRQLAYAAEQASGLPMQSDTVRAWLNKIGVRKLLNAEEEVELAKSIEAGQFAQERLDAAEAAGEQLEWQYARDLRTVAREGKRDFDHLMEANLRLVVSIAKRYTGHGMAFLDLIQEGNLGLHRAVQKFDYTKGYKFSTYATWWIRQAVARSMAEQARTIRIPVHLVEVINKMGRVQRDLTATLGRNPKPEEIAAEMDTTREKVVEILGYAREAISLDQEIGEDGDHTLGDLVADATTLNQQHKELMQDLLRGQIEEILQTLSEREATLVRLRFGLVDGESKSLDAIGKVLGVTRERVRQIELKVMGKLRHPTRTKALEAFRGDD